MTFSGVVVGLGNIGQGYDYQCSDGSRVLTHAQSFFHHPDFSLTGGVDPDPELRARFEKKFGKPAWKCIEDVPQSQFPHIWAVAVPTRFHLETIGKIIPLKPKAVICEKPLAVSLVEAQEIVRLLRDSRTPCLVNYIRRFEPGACQVKDMIDRKKLGDPLKGVVWYSKGLRHNGGHFLDLLQFWLGPISDRKVLERGRNFSENDFEPDLRLCFGKTPIYLLAGREECFSMKDIELIGTKGRIQYLRGGEKIVAQGLEEQKTFPGYKVLENQGKELPTFLHRYQWFVLEALKEHLVAGKPLVSNETTALKTMEILEEIARLRCEAES